MKLGKKELIISVVMLIVFLVLGLNFSVFATNTGNNSLTLNFNLSGNNNANNNIPVNNNANTNTAGKDVPNTGLEDAPWLVIAVCGVSAIFAFKKIKEYNEV